ncbi:DDB1- and CUL4-associated factor 4-like [Tupaia chinensis]|uniref:DDB1- and CUL4-associated factor 4-like n=1 Tax=Tupaia chinensis TaxID=246437 RepID=UPI000FFBCDCC|nr:DDB1- and CUL4-associated factor 4-like [Tupaia chinensis]
MHLPGAEKNQLGFLNTTNNHNLSQGLRVSSVQRKRAQTPNSDPSALARGQFNLMLADANSDRLFTLNQSGRLRVWHHQLAWPEDPVSQG